MNRRYVVRRNNPKPTQKQPLRRPAHHERTSEMRVGEAKRPKIHECPSCGQNDRLAEIDLIPGAAYGHFEKNGSWQFDGETKVFWDDQKAEHDPARFICLHCDTVFDLSGRIY